MFSRVCLIVLFAAESAWSQVDSSGAIPAAADERMVTPSPVSVEGPSLAFAAETERTNYLRGGLSFATAYDDGLLSSKGVAVSDVSYALRPYIAIDQSGARLGWNLSYSPGFTFYQRNTSLNQSDHDLALNFRYRLSPHVTLTLVDTLAKASVLSYRFNPSPTGSGSGLLQSPNQSIVSPVSDTISNIGGGQISYQFSANGMIGASGTATELRYLHRSQVPGLFDSSTRGATAFYSHRLSGRHYIGATYQFGQFLSFPQGTETRSHGVIGFYTFYLQPRMSLALLAGTQRSDVSGAGILSTPRWRPTSGGSFGWQGPHTSLNVNVAHRVSDGGGLQSGVSSNSADASIRHQLTKNLTAGLGGGYVTNSLLDRSLPGGNGHTVSGNLSLERSLGEHFSAQLGYSRLHQSYSNIGAISNFPERNRVFVSLSYSFQRPLGR